MWALRYSEGLAQADQGAGVEIIWSVHHLVSTSVEKTISPLNVSPIWLPGTCGCLFACLLRDCDLPDPRQNDSSSRKTCSIFIQKLNCNFWHEIHLYEVFAADTPLLQPLARRSSYRIAQSAHRMQVCLSTLHFGCLCSHFLNFATLFCPFHF